MTTTITITITTTSTTTNNKQQTTTNNDNDNSINSSTKFILKPSSFLLVYIVIDPDEYVRKNVATLIREVCKHNAELAQLVVNSGGWFTGS